MSRLLPGSPVPGATPVPPPLSPGGVPWGCPSLGAVGDALQRLLAHLPQVLPVLGQLQPRAPAGVHLGALLGAAEPGHHLPWGKGTASEGTEGTPRRGWMGGVHITSPWVVKGVPQPVRGQRGHQGGDGREESISCPHGWSGVSMRGQSGHHHVPMGGQWCPSPHQGTEWSSPHPHGWSRTSHKPMR